LSEAERLKSENWFKMSPSTGESDSIHVSFLNGHTTPAGLAGSLQADLKGRAGN